MGYWLALIRVHCHERSRPLSSDSQHSILLVGVRHDVDFPGTVATVHIQHSGADLACPQCGMRCSGYATGERKWRRLESCNYSTGRVAQVPRLPCLEHGGHPLSVPWVESHGRATALF